MSKVNSSLMRARWAAIGAAVAVSLGGGVVMVANAVTISSQSNFVSIQTCRILDTRQLNPPAGPDIGPYTRVGDGQTILVDIDETFQNQTCSGIPTNGVLSVLLNVTAVNPSQLSFMVLYPGDVSDANRPVGSNVNFKNGDAPTANQVTVLVGSNAGDNGLFKLYNHDGEVDVVIDINGYYLDDPSEP